MADFMRTTSSTVLAGVDGSFGFTAVPEGAVMVGYSLKEADGTRVPQGATLIGYEGEQEIRTTDSVVLAAYRTDQREDYNLRTFGFTFDGHPFYAIHLGLNGTWLYDSRNDQWSEWVTQGYTTWNFEYAIEYDQRIIGGDNQNSILWELDPASYLDEGFKPQQRKATGVVSLRSRDAVPVWALDVDATVDSYDGSVATMTLKISDNGGNTFNTISTKTLTADSNGFPISFRSLGTMRAPGRVYNIEDEGGPVTIRGASLRIDER